jgi:2',3'-cyclic-nucleotide 2'-phosphodiesterase (5'-nucleotidase family)
MSKLFINRRAAMTLLASSAVLPFFKTTPAAAASGIRVIVLSDLHSAYDRMGQLLATVEGEVASSRVPSIIVLNGDLFEAGNAVATRSGSEIDWAFLKGLSETAPTVMNIGNHESDIDNDLAHFVTRAEGLGVKVLTNITDPRTGALYAPSSATLEVGDARVTFAALGVDNLFTYPKATRAQLSVPEPVEWAKANLKDLLKDGDINIVLSHAGVMPDKAILPMLPDGTLMIGGHDHLNIEYSQGNTRYLHTGCWAVAATAAEIDGPNQAARFTRLDIDPTAPASEKLAALIPAVMAKYLTAEDTARVGKSGKAMSNDETGLFVAAAMAEKAGADIGFIGHTTFGAGLPEGDVSLYAFNSSVRFDGKMMKAEVDAKSLSEILARCNQFGDFAFAKRTGDYLYANPKVPGKDRFTIVCNDWSAKNQKSYFGREDMTFTEIPALMVKAVALEKLA